jgi:AraC-like DNA-binding protein
MPAAGQQVTHFGAIPEVVVCTGPAHSYRGNIHEALKLVFVPDAEMLIRRRGGMHRAGPGQLIAMHADEAHSGAPGATPVGRRGEWRLLCVPPHVLDQAGGAARFRFPDPVLADDRVARRYRSLLRTLRGAPDALRQETVLLGFVAGLAGHAEPEREPQRGELFRAAGIVRDYLGDNLGRNVTLAELESVTGVGRYRLLRACKARYGLPPHTMQLRLRLDRALVLIRHGRSLAEVGSETGFFDQSHFTHAFAQAYGMTPVQYRLECVRDRTDEPFDEPFDGD